MNFLKSFREFSKNTKIRYFLESGAMKTTTKNVILRKYGNKRKIW